MVKPFRTCQALLLKGAMEPDTIAPSLSFYNRNKNLKFTCFWAEMKKNARLLQKNGSKRYNFQRYFLSLHLIKTVLSRRGDQT